MIVTDTVGFIQGLPTELVEAFAATLEEVRQAHILCIVVDGSHPDAELQLETVLDTLAAMNCDQPSVLVVSKCDRLTATELRRVRLQLGDIAGTSPLAISSQRATGLRELRQTLDSMTARAVPDTRANRPSSAPADTEMQTRVAG